MKLDVKIRNKKNPNHTTTVLYNHWKTVLEPLGQWVVVEAHTKDLKVEPTAADKVMGSEPPKPKKKKKVRLKRLE